MASPEFDLILDLTDVPLGEERLCPLCAGSLVLEDRSEPNELGLMTGYYRCQQGHRIGVSEMKAPADVDEFVYNELPPKQLLDRIPTIAEVDDHGVDTAYMRYYNPAGRGEWFVLALDPPQTAWVWVRSPLGKGDVDQRYDELGMIELSALDYYARIFRIERIVRDETFTPRRFRIPGL